MAIGALLLVLVVGVVAVYSAVALGGATIDNEDLTRVARGNSLYHP